MIKIVMKWLNSQLSIQMSMEINDTLLSNEELILIRNLKKNGSKQA